jgi:hypothetical protein
MFVVATAFIELRTRNSRGELPTPAAPAEAELGTAGMS